MQPATPLLFIDKETTDLSPAVGAPIEISALVLGGEHDGKDFTAKMRPFDGAKINPFALEANGTTYDEIMTRPCPREVFANFQDWLNMTHPAPLIVRPAGYNYKFDEGFLREWYCRYATGDIYGHTFTTAVEVMDVIKMTWPHHVGTTFPKKGGMKLTFQHQYHFGTVHDKAHTALADCLATRALFLHADRTSGRNEYQQYHHYIPSTTTTQP